MNAPYIVPTVGRIVWFYRDHGQKEPIHATVIKVWGIGPGASCNLLCVDPDVGVTYMRANVKVGDDTTAGEHYRWMPYQQAQAAKATP